MFEEFSEEHSQISDGQQSERDADEAVDNEEQAAFERFRGDVAVACKNKVRNLLSAIKSVKQEVKKSQKPITVFLKNSSFALLRSKQILKSFKSSSPKFYASIFSTYVLPLLQYCSAAFSNRALLASLQKLKNLSGSTPKSPCNAAIYLTPPTHTVSPQCT